MSASACTRSVPGLSKVSIYIGSNLECSGRSAEEGLTNLGVAHSEKRLFRFFRAFLPAAFAVTTPAKGHRYIAESTREKN